MSKTIFVNFPVKDAFTATRSYQATGREKTIRSAQTGKEKMTNIEGFVAALPTANREKYRTHPSDAVPLFPEFGTARMVETRGRDVPVGKVTDVKGAVQAKGDETVVLPRFEYTDKATRDTANEKMRSVPRMKEKGRVDTVRRSAHVLGRLSANCRHEGVSTMANKQGDFIWYELMIDDADAAQDFYGKILGWTFRDSGQEGMDYRLFSADDEDVGGVMPLSHTMSGWRAALLGGLYRRRRCRYRGQGDREGRREHPHEAMGHPRHWPAGLRRRSSGRDVLHHEAHAARGKARPAFQRAFDAQLAVFTAASTIK